MDVDEDSDLPQFSPESAARLEAATNDLRSAIEQYASTVTQLRGGSADIPTIFAANAVVRRAAYTWDGAALDHTGTFPLALDDEFEEFGEGEEEEDGDEVEVVSEVSIVSRWDLDVTDAAALIEAARAAHRRSWPDESAEDARAAIGDDNIGRALYALIHDRGEPWFDLPGVFVLGGHRDYIDRDGEQPMTTADGDDDLDAPMRIPDGDIVYREGWQ